LAREEPTHRQHAPDVDLIGQPARHKADMLTATQRRVNSRSSMPTVVLASTSPYRRALLQRILTGFSTAAPPVDESRLDGETPGDMAARLATAKARAVAAGHPGAVVIGSDQVAELDGRLLGKPGDAARARAQLAASSGRTVRFFTAVCVIG